MQRGQVARSRQQWRLNRQSGASTMPMIYRQRQRRRHAKCGYLQHRNPPQIGGTCKSIHTHVQANKETNHDILAGPVPQQLATGVAAADEGARHIDAALSAALPPGSGALVHVAAGHIGGIKEQRGQARAGILRGPASQAVGGEAGKAVVHDGLLQ